MRIGRVDIPDERFHAVCDMGAAAVGLLTVLCAESDESGMVTMSVRDIAKSLNMRKSTVCETLHTIANIGVADVETRRGSRTSISFPTLGKVVPVADTLGKVVPVADTLGKVVPVADTLGKATLYVQVLHTQSLLIILIILLNLIV